MDKQFACDKCNYKAGSKGTLTRHQNSVQGDVKHVCNICGFTTT